MTSDAIASRQASVPDAELAKPSRIMEEAAPSGIVTPGQGCHGLHAKLAVQDAAGTRVLRQSMTGKLQEAIPPPPASARSRGMHEGSG